MDRETRDNAGFPRLDAPSPEVPASDIESRLERIRGEMEAAGMNALIVSSRQNVEYFTGYRTASWTSNTRPVFAVVDPENVVIIGSMTEERNIKQKDRPFSAKHYHGFVDEAIAELSSHVATLMRNRPFRVGLDYGQDMFGRGSIELMRAIEEMGASATEAAEVIWRVRLIKSRYEADMKRTAFTIVNRAFDEVIRDIRIGCSEVEVYRRLQASLALSGADALDPFTVIFGNSEFAYCRPPTDRRLKEGQYLWTDFRASYAGYPGDRNRIAKAGEPDRVEKQTYSTVRQLTRTLGESIRPGMTGGEIYSSFVSLWREAGLGTLYERASRIGHGGGMDLTEPPSLMKGSAEVVREGMILHVEPKLEARGAVFQFEDIIWIQSGGNEFLSEPHPPELPVIAA